MEHAKKKQDKRGAPWTTKSITYQIKQAKLKSSLPGKELVSRIMGSQMRLLCPNSICVHFKNYHESHWEFKYVVISK